MRSLPWAPNSAAALLSVCAGSSPRSAAKSSNVAQNVPHNASSRRSPAITGESSDAACAECGNDDPCEGYAYCSDCLESGVAA